MCSIVLGVCDALTATPKGNNVTRTSHRVSQRAEELTMRLCGLGAIASVKVRGVLVSAGAVMRGPTGQSDFCFIFF